MPTIRPIWLILFACGLFSLSFGWPLLTHLSATGIWDWSEAASHYEATRNTIFTYGQFPLWNPYVCGGGPSLGNPQTYWLSLTGLLALMSNSIVGPKIAVLLYVFLGGIGTWLLARQLKISRAAGLLAIPIFLTSGYLATHLAAGQFLWLTLAWVPFVWLGYLKSVNNWRWLIFGGLALAMIGLEGRSYLVAYLLVMLLTYGFMADLVGTSRRSFIRAGLLLLIAFGLGAWKFIPDILFLAVAQENLPNTLGIPLSLLPSMYLLRDVSPNADYALRFFESPRPWFEFGYYLGIIPLALALVGFLKTLRNRRYIPWLFTGIIMLAIALGSESNNILELVPVLQELRNQQRAMSMVIFIIAILAAFGLDSLVKKWTSKKTAATILAVIVIVFVTIDLGSVTRPALSEGYAKIAVPESGDGPTHPIYPLIEQGEGLNNPFPQVIQNHGAASYCPAIFNAWYIDSPVTFAAMESHRGEVFMVDQGELVDFLVTPNIITAQVTTKETTLLVINQNANPGWHTSAGQIADYQKLLAVTLPPGDHNVVLQYRPPGIRLGLVVSLFTLLIWLAVEIKLRRYRVEWP